MTRAASAAPGPGSGPLGPSKNGTASRSSWVLPDGADETSMITVFTPVPVEIPCERDHKTMSEVRSGVEVLLEVLATERVRHIFGNPGTTELPLIGALAGDDRFHYVLALHESVAAGMADGYAQATGRPSFLNVHTATGLGNAMGNLSNSRATGSPIVVTAGQQDRRHLLAEPFLSGNLTGMAAGLVKWAHEVHRTADLGPVLRRAFHDAASPPTGPVFVSIPMDVLQDEGEFAVPAASRIERRAVPAALADLASAILAAPRARFAVVAGDEVARSAATGALAALAERLGCRVYGTAMHSTLVFPTDHPLWAGALPADAEQVRAHLAGLHTVLLIGSRGFMTFGYRETWPVPPELGCCTSPPPRKTSGGPTRPGWGWSATRVPPSRRSCRCCPGSTRRRPGS